MCAFTITMATRAPNIAGGILAGLGAITAGISCAITGIQSSKVQASNKNSLLASSALTGFGTIFLIIAFVLLGAYHKTRQSSTNNAKKGLIITFFVLAGLYVIMILTAGIIAGVVGNKAENAEQKNSMIAAAVLPVFSLIFFVIAYIVIAKHNYGVQPRYY